MPNLDDSGYVESETPCFLGSRARTLLLRTASAIAGEGQVLMPDASR